MHLDGLTDACFHQCIDIQSHKQRQWWLYITAQERCDRLVLNLWCWSCCCWICDADIYGASRLHSRLLSHVLTIIQKSTLNIMQAIHSTAHRCKQCITCPVSSRLWQSDKCQPDLVRFVCGQTFASAAACWSPAELGCYLQSYVKLQLYTSGTPVAPSVSFWELVTEYLETSMV